ncbi:MAG: caspase family protein [Crocosphaera sp.]
MDNFRAIAIGIEEYLHYQPLTGAENNAQALYRYFFEEANIPCHQLLLLTDTSPSPGKRSTYPNRDNILQWINDGPIKVEYSWFFFQGYGINYQGEDYLLPIDSTPQNFPQTGIKVRSLLEKLQVSSQKLLVILDLQNPLKDGKLGQLTLELAQKKGISLIFSCRSHIYQSISAEKSIFITALIEALRYYGHHLTLTKLDSYLQERLTPFHQSHFPAIALPIIISPSTTLSHQPLLPPLMSRKVVGFHQQESRENKTTSFTVKQRSPQTTVKQPTTTLNLPNLPPSSFTPQLSLNVPLKEIRPTIATPPLKKKIVSPTTVTPSQQKSSLAYGKWLLWGGGLLGGISILWLMSLKIRQHLNAVNYEKIQEHQQILDYGKIPLSWQQASRFNEAIGYARQIEPHTPLYRQAQGKISHWSQIILDIAQGRAIQGDFTGAIAAAKLVPKDDHSLYLLAQQSLENWQKLSQQQADNQVLIEAALSLIQPNQASSYNQAIRTLKHLEIGQSGYSQAQDLIEQLSQHIYQLAQNRAKLGQLTLAIETVDLVPEDSKVYTTAQQAKRKWQKRLQRP